MYRSLTQSCFRASLALAFAVLAVLGLVAGALAESGGAEVSTFYEDALVRYHEGDRVGAAVQLKNVLQARPNHLPARVLLGRIYLDEGAAEAAEKQFRDARRLGADEALLAVPLAQAYLLQRKFREVLLDIPYTHFPAALEARILTFRGTALTERREYERAQEAFRRAEALVPQAPEAVAGRAVIALRQGRMDEARRLAEEAVGIGERSPEAWNALASVNHASGKLREALVQYGKALALRSNLLEARIARIGVALDLGEEEIAGNEIAAVRATYPDEPRAAFLQSILLSRQGDADGAKAALSESAQLLANLSPDQQSSQSKLLLMGGIANFDLKANQQAESYLRRYLEKRPGDPGARRLLASIYLQKGWNDDVIGLLRPLVAREQPDPRDLSMLATAYSRQSRPRQATPLLERAVKASGEAPVYVHQLAMHYVGLGRRQRALELLERLVAAHGDFVQGYLSLTTVHLAARGYLAAIASARKGLARAPENENLRNLLGVALTQVGKLDEAKKEFERLRARDSAYVPARINLAKLAALRGEPDAAIRDLEAVVEEYPGNHEAMLELARFLFRHRQPEAALRWARKAYEAESRSVRVVSELVRLLLAAKQPKAALKVAKEAETWASESADVQLLLARSYLAIGKPALAVVSLKQAATDAGYDVPLLLRIAALQASSGAWEDADWSLQKAVKEAPKLLTARVKLVEAQISLGRLDKARAEAETIQRDFPDRAAGLGLLGEIALRQGDTMGAERYFRRALGQTPSDLGALRYYQAWSQRDPDAAAAWLRDWTLAHPRDIRSRTALAERMLATGRPKEAATEYAALVERRPRDPDLWNNLANAYLEANDREQALRAARRAKSLAPDDPGVNDTLGWLLIRSGQTAEGLALLRSAQTRAAGSPEIRYHIAVALRRLDRLDEARRELEFAISSGQRFPGLEAARKLLAEVAR